MENPLGLPSLVPFKHQELPAWTTQTDHYTNKQFIKRKWKIELQALFSRPFGSDEDSPTHICLTTCDNRVYWLHGQSFKRKLVAEGHNTSAGGVPFNNDFGGDRKTHLCYTVHQRSGDTYPSTCIYDVGSPVVQVPANRKANIFNSLYWQRCDGTVRNALDEYLISILPKHQKKLAVKLGDVIEPKQEKVSEFDMATFETWKDTFIRRFM
ncbi:hypothetical protein H2198_002804 [Neophaeococcomyces mojaviensis]|uniref:Uncharacterized protein n=1 Tax=Neophaeococcomyces mojaviensis TaxID=3383035 RepID=A0ACC3ADW4_9EURO|nr:hypothetical protein H2198_002804 [Knufia sp. JES_112]